MPINILQVRQRPLKYVHHNHFLITLRVTFFDYHNFKILTSSKRTDTWSQIRGIQHFWTTKSLSRNIDTKNEGQRLRPVEVHPKKAQRQDKIR